MTIKLNIGASPIWRQDGWHVLDHKLQENTKTAIAGDAANINLPDQSCEAIFCSHMFEHIPHTKLPLVVCEINRLLEPGGIFRMLTPDLEIITRAYVEKDESFFKEALAEDENIRTDLGFGGMFMNFVVSSGQDTALLDRNLKSFIGGYAHLYNYDYDMMNIMLSRLGFKCRKAEFNDSEIIEMQTPLHVEGLNPEWQNFNKQFYLKNNLVHRLINGTYEINFKTTGFDRDPLTSLIVEAKKIKYVNKKEADMQFNYSQKNYNRYGYSLLSDNAFRDRLEELGIDYPAVRSVESDDCE